MEIVPILAIVVSIAAYLLTVAHAWRRGHHGWVIVILVVPFGIFLYWIVRPGAGPPLRPA